MSNKKYEFTGETKEWCGHTLHRIRAVISFAYIKAGEMGGWIETEDNLSHNGDAWVYGDAKVYGDAIMSYSKTTGRLCGGLPTRGLTKNGRLAASTALARS